MTKRISIPLTSPFTPKYAPSSTFECLAQILRVQEKRPFDVGFGAFDALGVWTLFAACGGLGALSDVHRAALCHDHDAHLGLLFCLDRLKKSSTLGFGGLCLAQFHGSLCCCPSKLVAVVPTRGGELWARLLRHDRDLSPEEGHPHDLQGWRGLLSSGLDVFGR